MHLLFCSAGAVSEAELGNHVTYTPTKTATGTVATHYYSWMLLPWWFPAAGSCPSLGLSRAKPAWLSGGIPPTKAPVDGEGMSAEVLGWEEEGPVIPCGMMRRL